MGLEMWSAMAWEAALNGINIDWTHHGTSRKNRFIFLWHHPANSFSSSPSQSHCLSQSKISIVYNFLLHTGTKHPVIFNSILQNRQFHGKRSILILAVHGKPCFHGREWHKADRVTLEMSCAACFEMLACVFASAEDLLWIAFKNCIFDTLITTRCHKSSDYQQLIEGYQKIKNPAILLDFLRNGARNFVLEKFQLSVFSRRFSFLLLCK